MQTRRTFLELTIGTAGAVALGACDLPDPSDGSSSGRDDLVGDTGPLDTAIVDPTCGAVTAEGGGEGPYYRPDAPSRTDLRTLGETGTTFTLNATVRSSVDCALLAGAIVEIWHAKQDGTYDMDTTDLHYRTTLRAGFDGRITVVTLVPPAYYLSDGRLMARHFHVRINADDHHELLTQLRWEGDEMSDGFEYDDLLMTPTVAADGSESVDFEFVLEHV